MCPEAMPKAKAKRMGDSFAMARKGKGKDSKTIGVSRLGAILALHGKLPGATKQRYRLQSCNTAGN